MTSWPALKALTRPFAEFLRQARAAEGNQPRSQGWSRLMGALNRASSLARMRPNCLGAKSWILSERRLSALYARALKRRASVATQMFAQGASAAQGFRSCAEDERLADQTGST